MTKQVFKPAWWLPGPHLQTLWPGLCRRRQRGLVIRHQRLELPDGDFIDLAFAGQGGPIVLILHGLEGSVDSSYARGMLKACESAGWQGVLMHFRGCSGEPNRLPRAYHSGETEDLAQVVSYLQSQYPQQPITAVGFSLGANVLLKWLGESGASNPLKAAVAISVPFELNKCSRRVQRGFSRIYQWQLLRSLCKRLKHKFERYPLAKPIVLDDLKTLWDFDERLTAPLHGFASAAEYYQRSSSRQYLKGIAVPTLIIQAKDDPFMSLDLLPEAPELSSKVQFELSERGGHVGFVSGTLPWRAKYWLEQRVPDFLAEYL